METLLHPLLFPGIFRWRVAQLSATILAGNPKGLFESITYDHSVSNMPYGDGSVN